MKRVRARVLKVDGNQVTLGVFRNGFWQRIEARTEVSLVPGSWIEGEIEWSSDGSEVLFRVKQEPQPTDGIDYEA